MPRRPVAPVVVEDLTGVGVCGILTLALIVTAVLTEAEGLTSWDVGWLILVLVFVPWAARRSPRIDEAPRLPEGVQRLCRFERATGTRVYRERTILARGAPFFYRSS